MFILNKYFLKYMGMMLPVFLLVNTAKGQYFEAYSWAGDSIRKSVSVSGHYGYNSNALTNEFTGGFISGAYLDDAMKDRVKDRLSDYNRFGGDIQYNIHAVVPMDTFLRKTGYSIIAGLGNTEHFDAGFTEDFFTTVFYGNKFHAGDTAVFDRTNFNFYRYQSLDIGLIKESETEPGFREGIVISFIKGEQMSAFRSNDAFLYTREDGKEVELGMNYNYMQSDSLNKSLPAFNGYGISSDLFTRIPLGDSSVINIHINDIGFIAWNKHSVRMNGDTSISFSGLEIDNVFEANDSIAGNLSRDSLRKLIRHDAYKKPQSIALPTTFHVSLQKDFNEMLRLNAGFVYRILANYQPYFYLQGRMRFHSGFAFKVSTGYGGYGKFNAGLCLSKNINDNFSIALGSYNIESLIDQKSTGGGSAFLVLNKYF